VATFSAVTRQHILQAIAEYDTRGPEDFLGVYGFEPSPEYALVHEGRRYDSKAVLGVAHRYATGRIALSDEFHGGMHAAATVLRKRGFEVDEPRSTPGAAPRPAAGTARRAATATRAVRKPAVPERVAPICPTCSTTLPGTGICDYCG